MKEKTLKIIGVLCLIGGSLFLANSLGYFELSAEPFAAANTHKGAAAISSSSNFGTPEMGMFLSTVTPANTYEWKVTVKNTGDVDWNDGHYTVRLSKSKDNPDVSNLGTRRVTEETTAGGKTLVLEGDYTRSYTYNDINLRDSIRSEWSLDSSDYLSVDNRVASVDIGALQTGQSKTVSFEMSVPQDLNYMGDRILVGNAAAWVGGAWVVDSNRDTVSAGGGSILEFVGSVALSIFGAALAFGGRFW